MQIKEMFSKDITRDIQGVIVVGEGEKASVQQELEEYVVTRELQKYFREFFANYKKSLTGKTTKTGVWISGFFGSGKSHFLKMLSYLLGNKEVAGKNALAYLVDNEQIKDPMLRADMQLAADTPTDVVLFNIDSKSEQTSKNTKDAIVMVFLKVFNEMQGFYGAMPYVADLERQLSEDGRYEEFQAVFAEKYHKPWLASRNRFDYIQDTIVSILDEMGYMSEAAARNWCEKATEPYQISIERFAEMVRDYVDRKGKKHHIIFLVDEVGQYIGDNSQLMLNLQTMREELGKACQGRAWVIVTSQQDIDSITNVKGNDFSKIQGRFDTRLSLSSANVDEVIKERILRKTPVAAQSLRLLYGEADTKISNIITFENTAEMKLYASEEDFASCYPFVPYQFQLLAKVLTSIRTHGASGKHLSEGERSMLALFKESAEALKEKEAGALVPFYLFYDALENFLDAAHSRVIRQALENGRINPDRREDCFAVNVLKCLFLIKYVKEFEHATLPNIVSLMISHVDDDRAALVEQVEEALRVLIQETLVQKHNNIYVFLTEEEQEIGREIRREPVEMGEIITKMSAIIFGEIFAEGRYKCPKFKGRYVFPINQIVDERRYKTNQSFDIGLRILTPYDSLPIDEATLCMISTQEREVLVALPDDRACLEETRQALQIEKYLARTAASAPERHREVRDKKKRELLDCFSNAKLYLTEALKEAPIYLNGGHAEIHVKDVALRLTEAVGKLVEAAYNKLYYIDTAFSVDDIRNLLGKASSAKIELSDMPEPNEQAQKDVLSFITSNSQQHTKVSLKTLKDKFRKVPYGFVDDDVEWLVARLFTKGDIALYLNGSPVTLANNSVGEIVNFLTKKEFVEKLCAEYRVKRSDKELKNVKTLLKDVFDVTAMHDGEDGLLQEFQECADNMVRTLEDRLKYEYVRPYPGRQTVEVGLKLLRSLSVLGDPAEFYPQLMKKRDELLDFAEDYEPINSFFAGEAKGIFDKALALMEIYEKSKNYIVDEALESTVQSIQDILRAQRPPVKDLPPLLETYREAYTNLLDAEAEPVAAQIEAEKARLLEVLAGKPYAEKCRSAFVKKFADLLDKAQHCNSVMELRSFADQAGVVKQRFLNQMYKMDEELAKQAAEAKAKEKSSAKASDTASSGDIKETASAYRIKKKKNLSIKAITRTSSWHIESRADIDKYVGELRTRLEQELTDETIVDIEF